MPTNFLSQRLSEFDLGKKGTADFDPTKVAGASLDPFMSIAKQKPDLSEFTSTARASGPRLQTLARRLPDLSSIKAFTSGDIEESPSFKAAIKAYESGVEPAVINQMGLRGLGSGTALAGALGRTRSQAVLPIIQEEQARKERAIRSIAGFEEAGIGRELGAAEFGDRQLLNALLEEAGVSERATGRELAAGERGLERLLHTGLTETGRTFTAEEAEKDRALKRELADEQLQAILALAVGEFGTKSLPTILQLLGLGTKTGGTTLADLLGLSGKGQGTQGGTGGLGQTAASAALSAATALTKALISAGMSPGEAVSRVQQILIEDAEELTNLGQFDESTFAPFITRAAESAPFDLSLPIGQEDLPGLIQQFFPGLEGEALTSAMISSGIPAEEIEAIRRHIEGFPTEILGVPVGGRQRLQETLRILEELSPLLEKVPSDTLETFKRVLGSLPSLPRGFPDMVILDELPAILNPGLEVPNFDPLEDFRIGGEWL